MNGEGGGEREQLGTEGGGARRRDEDKGLDIDEEGKGEINKRRLLTELEDIFRLEI